MSDWVYLVIAFTVVWGGLAIYALVLARRVTQAADVERTLQDGLVEPRQDDVGCDAPPSR